MIKKTLFAVAVVAILAAVFFGRDAASYVRTSAGYVSESVKSNVPMEFEIQRARDMVNNLMPEVRRNMHVIAKEEVEVEHLKKRIADAAAGLAADKEEILRLKADLAEVKETYMYGGREYNAEQVKQDLANRFERYKTAEATLESLKQIEQARQTSLDAGRRKLEGMLAERRKLLVEVENLEARLQMVAAAKTTSDYHFDDSALGHTKELIADLQKKLDVEATLVNAEGSFHDEIPLDEPAPVNIVEEVSQYFGGNQVKPEELAAH